MPVLGTACRVLYLGIILALLYGVAGRLTTLPPFPALSMVLTPYLGWGLVGLVAMDALHSLLDVI